MQITKWPPFIKPFWERKRRKWWDICLNLCSQQAFWCARKCPGVGWQTMWAPRCVFSKVFVVFLSVFYHLGDIFHTRWIMCKKNNFCARCFAGLHSHNTIVFLCQIQEAHWRVKLNKKYKIDCGYCKPLLAAEAPCRQPITAPAAARPECRNWTSFHNRRTQSPPRVNDSTKKEVPLSLNRLKSDCFNLLSINFSRWLI